MTKFTHLQLVIGLEMDISRMQGLQKVFLRFFFGGGGVGGGGEAHSEVPGFITRIPEALWT